MPYTEDSLYIWVAGLMVGYLLVFAFLRSRCTRKLPSDPAVLVSSVFDAATFAVSLMLFWGVIDARVLAAIGSTKLFLLIAAIAGAVYGLHQLWKLRN